MAEHVAPEVADAEVLDRLEALAGIIPELEQAVADAYAERLGLWQRAREFEPKTTTAKLAEHSSVTEPAVSKALRRAEARATS